MRGTAGPATSSPVRWVATPSDFADPALREDRDSVPVLRPSDVLACRWQKVIETGYAGPRERAGRACVIALSQEVRPLAEHFAARTGARPVSGTGAAERAALIRACPEPQVVLVGLAGDLRVRDVRHALDAGREAGKSFGILVGRDPTELSFAIAKALLRPRPELQGLQLFDAPSHGPDPAAAPVQVDELLAPARVKVIRAHGEGGHAKLGAVVVCGVLEDAEFPEAPDAGCAQTPRRCKRALASGAEVVFGHELTAAVICFVCCNGFNVAGELYPSPVSLALSFLQGGAAAVIAPLRPLVAPDALMDTLRDELAGGLPLGEVVRRLNELSGQHGDPDAFVLLGDPDVCAVEASGADVVTRPPRAVFLPEDERAWLFRLAQHAERGRRILRSTRAWLGDAPNPELDALDRQLAEIERALVNAIKWAQSGLGEGSLERLRATLKLLRLRVTRWDEGAALLLIDHRGTLDPFDIGHYDQAVAECRTDEPCSRCGTPTEVHVYGRYEPAVQHREARMCAVCGPVSESRAQGLRIALTVPERAVAGTTVSLRVDLAAPADAPPLSRHAYVRLRCFDKANDRLIHDVRTVLAVEDSSFDTSFELDGASPDLHSVRAVAVSAFDVAYARGRLACLPVDRRRPVVARADRAAA